MAPRPGARAALLLGEIMAAQELCRCRWVIGIDAWLPITRTPLAGLVPRALESCLLDRLRGPRGKKRTNLQLPRSALHTEGASAGVSAQIK